MQPPPRKGNYAKFLKNVHAEQAAKLLAKNQHECDLLEDIRNFVLKKSAIEKSYAEALLKISSAYLNKKIPNIPDIKTDAADDRWNMWNVWRTVLEENEKLARARLAAVEIFQSQIADEAKSLRMHKVQISKKAVDQLIVVQKELQLCVQDVDKTKKLYFDEEHSAHDVRDKAKDIEEKLKKKKGSFFQSITSLQKNSAKVTSKRDALDEKSTGARNDYLLALAAANAHQTRYFVVDFQSTMLHMEQNVYDKVAEYLSMMGRTELLTCMALQNSFSIIRDQAQQLTREYNIQCVTLYYPVLKQHIQYPFEPCDNDPLDRITVDNAAAQTLTKEARRWATKIAREINTYRESSRKLNALQGLRDSGQKTDPNDPNGPDLETKMEELRQTMRKAETAKMKAEARIECLRKGGVNVDEFLQEMETLSVGDIQRSASSLSLRTDGSGKEEPPSSDSFYDSDNDGGGSDHTTVERPSKVSTAQQRLQHDDENSGSEERQRHDSAEVDALLEQEKQKIDQITHGWDDPTSVDWGNEDVEVANATQIQAGSDPVPVQNIYKCTALYSYTAQNPDELSIVESEQLEVVGEGDGDGWLRARNYRGEEGYVPQNYLDVEREPEPQQTGLVSQQPGIQQQISFSSVDYTIDDHDAVDPDAHLREQQELAAQEKVTAAPVFTAPPAPVETSAAANHVDDGREYCIAMYDYEATCEEELTFMEGDIIVITKKDPHDVDDGWWEGRLNGVSGLFPSLVVEPCLANGASLNPEEDELSEEEEDVTPPSTFAPPVFTPPEAPEFQFNEELAKSLMNEMRERGYVNGDRADSFDMNLTNNQKEQYGLQFEKDEEPEPEPQPQQKDEPPKKDEPQPTPGIIIDEVPDRKRSDDEDEDEEPEPVKAAREAKQKTSASDDSGLEVAQIVITAATPMDEVDKPFPGAEEEAPQEKKPEPEPVKEPAAPTVAEEVVTRQESPPEEPTRTSRLKKGESEDKSVMDDQPADSAPFPVSSSSGSDAESVSGPSTGENSQCLPPQPRHGGPACVDEEEEVASPPPSGKMLVGGRASIPDELQPDQLQKLQNLKESNA